MTFEEERSHINPWSDIEKCIFLDRFLQHPKDFKKIASFLKNKSTRDCVAFYYDSKQSIPYKRALREHVQRKKRKADVSWESTIQAALSVGVLISVGTCPDKPLLFSLPANDFTFATQSLHPLKKEIFVGVNGEKQDLDIPENTHKKRWTLFSLDPKCRKYAKLPSKAQESIGNSRKADGGKKKTNDVDKVKSPVAKKPPQKWSATEKKSFYDTVQNHGKNWAKLQKAVPSKSMTQIKNYYYDHKKQFSKQAQESVDKHGKANPPNKATATKQKSQVSRETKKTPAPNGAVHSASKPAPADQGTGTPTYDQQVYQAVAAQLAGDPALLSFECSSSNSSSSNSSSSSNNNNNNNSSSKQFSSTHSQASYRPILPHNKLFKPKRLYFRKKLHLPRQFAISCFHKREARSYQTT